MSPACGVIVTMLGCSWQTNAALSGSVYTLALLPPAVLDPALHLPFSCMHRTWLKRKVFMLAANRELISQYAASLRVLGTCTVWKPRWVHNGVHGCRRLLRDSCGCGAIVCCCYIHKARHMIFSKALPSVADPDAQDTRGPSVQASHAMHVWEWSWSWQLLAGLLRKTSFNLQGCHGVSCNVVTSLRAIRSRELS